MTLNNQIYSDFDISLKTQNDGDITRDLEEEAVKNSLNNIFSTLKGERRMLPQFATVMSNLLFEPMDDTTAKRIGRLIREAIERWEDRVIVRKIHINANYDLMQYECTLSFRIIPSKDYYTTTFILKQG